MRFPLFVVCLLAYSAAAGEAAAGAKFNHFKSYEKAKVKPERYVDIVTTHPEDEYLDGSQKIMLRKRTSQYNHPGDMFDNSWTGYTKKTPTDAYRKKKAAARARRNSGRRLRGGERIYLHPPVFWQPSPSFSLFSFLLFVTLGVLYCTIGDSFTTQNKIEML